MIAKISVSTPGVWKPAQNGDGKLLSGSCEVTALKLVCGGGAAHASVYNASDSSGAIEANLQWVLDASTSDNDINVFSSPLKFDKGVYVVLDQGGGFNPEICMSRH